MEENKLAMIVLAGGASSRMGKEKSDLKLDGKSFLEIQIQKGRDLGVGRIYVSGYRGAHCTEEIVMDRIKERGPLGGLEACLNKAAQDGAEHCLVLGVDTPLVPVSELQNLIQSASADDQNRVTLLRHNGKEESLWQSTRSVYQVTSAPFWNASNLRFSVSSMRSVIPAMTRRKMTGILRTLTIQRYMKKYLKKIFRHRRYLGE